MKDRQTNSGRCLPAPPRSSGLVARLTRACRGPYALPAFGALSALESSFIPLPIDLAMMPLGLAQPRRIHLVVLAGAIGSTIGAIIGYIIGAFFMATVGWWLVGLYGFEEDIATFMAAYDSHGWKAVMLAGITPLPFTVATVMSGASGMSFPVFLAAAFTIRLVRFALMGLIIRLFGAGVARIMNSHTGALAVAIIIVTFLGFLAVPLLMAA